MTILFRLALAKPVAKPIRCDDIENFPRCVAMLFDGEVGKFFFQTVRLELGKQRLEIVYVESASVLRRITAILREPHLDLVAGKHRRPVWLVAPRRYSKPQHRFIE